jgi:dienelactone hydrolase
MKSIALALAGALTFALGISAEAQKKDVDIKAPDGTNLKGTYFSPGRRGPAILLLHQCNMDRHAWDGLAQDLASGGFHVLTLDYRGYGESGQHFANQDDRRKTVQEKWPSDVDAAYTYLLEQNGVDKTRIAAGGASCGVTQSSNLATRHHEIKALMLLSGTASDEAKAYIADNPAIPVFGAASEGDTSAAKGIKEVVEVSKNPHTTIKIYAGTEHGAAMFAKNSDLEPVIVSWLSTQLTGHAGTH